VRCARSRRRGRPPHVAHNPRLAPSQNGALEQELGARLEHRPDPSTRPRPVHSPRRALQAKPGWTDLPARAAKAFAAGGAFTAALTCFGNTYRRKESPHVPPDILRSPRRSRCLPAGSHAVTNRCPCPLEQVHRRRHGRSRQKVA
jgi:hypothetical protein